MAKIRELKINNFRGIKAFSQKFDKNLICLLGRGDSGKTTILDAISSVLSPSWNLTFYDSDFHNGKTENPIEIEVSLTGLPDSLIKDDKYGLHIRGLAADGTIHDDVHDDHEKILTVKLEVTKDLEPQWFIINSRQEEPKRISAPDRARLNVFVVSDYIDRHFSWSRGNPLYSILKERHDSDDKNDVIIEAVRGAKEMIDQYGFDKFNEITGNIKEASSNFGIDLSGAKTTVDFKDVSIKDGRVCLHDGDVPLRLKGKGSKRLISIAIQTVLAKHGGIMLIDEVEQGLEPDRVKHLVRSLKKDNSGQIFMTTHSSEVITELEVDDLMKVANNAGEVAVSAPDEDFQGVIRVCPEAMYAEKVIVCEGKTEIGICRALDAYRKKNSKEYMSFKDCVYTVGGGDSFPDRAIKLKNLGLTVCVFCDSDKDGELKATKETLISAGIEVFDCDAGKAIEEQVFQDIPWDGVRELLDYARKSNGLTSVKESIKSRYTNGFPDDFTNEDTPKMRTAIGSAAKEKKWFKDIGHGEFLGDVICDCIERMEGKNLKEQLDKLSDWIDEE